MTIPTPPEVPQNAPEQTPQTPPQPTPSTPPVTPPNPPAQHQSGAPNFGEILTALNGLPEKIVNGLREATQAAVPPAQTPPAQSPAQSGNTPQQPAQQSAQTPQKKTFAQWWVS